MFGDDRFMKTSSLAPGGLFIRAIDVPALGWGWEIPAWLLVDGLGHATHTGGASTDRKNSRRLIYACASYRPHFNFFLLSLLLLLFFWPLLFLTMAMDVNYFSEAHRWRRDGGGIYRMCFVLGPMRLECGPACRFLPGEDQIRRPS